MGIVRVSSCMGHLKSHYMAGIMNMIGLGVPQDLIQVCYSVKLFTLVFFRKEDHFLLKVKSKDYWRVSIARRILSADPKAKALPQESTAQ